MLFFHLPATMAQRLAQTTDAAGVAHFEGLPRESSMAVKIADLRFASPASYE